MVVDVPVLMQYVFVKVPQIQFIVRLCEHPVVHRDGYSQCKLCRNRRIPQGSSWDGCSRARCCAATGAWWFRQCSSPTCG